MATRYWVGDEEPMTILDISSSYLWGLAVLFFGVGDVVSTVIGLKGGQLAEVGPLVAPVIELYGFGALVGLKLGTFLLCYGLWRVTPYPHRIGVPLGLAVLGILVTAWNTSLILLVI